MTNWRNVRWYFILGLLLFVFSGIMLSGFTHSAAADEGGFHHQEFVDSRYQHNHSYPVRGQFIEALPGDHRAAVYGRSRYYFHGGTWYRPQGRRFVVIAPPFGMIIPFLPPFYSTIWVGGIPYYYANEAYYTQGAGGYIVVEPPNGERITAPTQVDQTSTNRIFIYPRQGQSEQKQADDRYECHSWAANQTGYDPIKPPANLPDAQMIQKRNDYQRASAACLDGRGYTVK